MYPTLVELGDITLRSYPVMILLAVITTIGLGPWWAARLEGLDPRRSFQALLWIGLGVFATARAHFVLTHLDLFSSRPLRAIAFWSGGIHAGGAIVGMVLFGPLVLRRFQIPVARFADGFAPALGIGIAVARLGCFLQGCCFGKVCRWPWGIHFPADTYIHQFHSQQGLLPPGATETAPIHPLQLYFAGAGLLLTVAALWVHRRKRYDGQVGLITLLLYSAGSAVLEPFRADYHPRVYWGPLPQLEWVALALTAGSLAALAIAEWRHRHDRASQGREGSAEAGSSLR